MHGMEDFGYDRAKTELKIPDGFRVEAIAAVSKPGAIETLPEKLRGKESPNERRRLSRKCLRGLIRVLICKPGNPFCYLIDRTSLENGW